MFRVEWLESALDELTTVWMQAESSLRPAITAATHQIDQQLRADPIGCSESRSGETRVLFEKPLGVNFYVESPEVRFASRAFGSIGSATPSSLGQSG
jgi:hypothetical protein